MKSGACVIASSKSAALMPTPTLPTGAMNRICCDFPFAIVYYFSLAQGVLVAIATQ
jgi:hypothetical protein